MKSKLISINGNLIGIIGMDEVFADLFKADRKPGEELGNLLLERLKEHNYIPESAESEYRRAFLREYEKFYNAKKGLTEGDTRKQKMWQGIPREEVPWFPTIIEGLCDGCKICLKFCPFGVYEWDEDSRKVNVAKPFNCYVGCSTCATKCKPRAIMFPPHDILKRLKS